jgi:hypothetical protein
MNGSQEEIDQLFILFRTLDKISYHILLIMHAYNAGISWLRSYVWLQSHASCTSWLWSTSQLRMSLLTLVVHHDSGQWARRLSYHLSCERLQMARLEDCIILQIGHLVENRLGGMPDSISAQNLRSHNFACRNSQTMCHATKEHLACCDLRKSEYPEGLGTQQP